MTMGAQIPVIVEKPLAACGCRKFYLDATGDHLCTCATHSGAKKAHDWVVDQLTDLFRNTLLKAGVDIVGISNWKCTLRTRRTRCLWCWTYPNDMDKSLHESSVDKIRKYRSDYNHNPPSSVSFMTAITNTSGRLHSEFIRLILTARCSRPP
jgi:hypothetical protein